MPSAVQHNCPCSPLLLLLHESLSLDARVHVCFYKGDSIMIVRGSWHSAVCQDAVTEAMRGAWSRSPAPTANTCQITLHIQRVTSEMSSDLSCSNLACACIWVWVLVIYVFWKVVSV